MKVILVKDTPKIGKAGDIKEVSNGYALNFLLPKGFAKIATAAGLRQVEDLKKKQALEAADLQKGLRLQANALRDRSVVIRTKAEEGRLFGSVGADEIAAALAAEGIEVDAKVIQVPKAFKMVGQYEVTAHFGHDIEAVFEVKIQGE
jgi:large subunit ribosomal protein L9